MNYRFYDKCCKSKKKVLHWLNKLDEVYKELLKNTYSIGQIKDQDSKISIKDITIGRTENLENKKDSKESQERKDNGYEQKKEVSDKSLETLPIGTIIHSENSAFVKNKPKIPALNTVALTLNQNITDKIDKNPSDTPLVDKSESISEEKMLENYCTCDLNMKLKFIYVPIYMQLYIPINHSL